MMSLVFLLLFSCSSRASTPFSDALKEIVNRSTSVGVQKSRLDAAEYALRSKRLFLLPSLSLNGTQQKQGDPEVTTNQVEAALRLNVFRFGADRAALKAAKAAREYERSLLEQSQLKAEQEGAELLIEYVSSRQQIAIFNKRLEYTRELLSIAQLRYKKGLLPLEEASRIEIDLSNEDAQLADAQTQFNSAQARLLSLLGQTDVQTVWPWKASMSSNQTVELTKHLPQLEVLPEFGAASFLLESESEKAVQLRRLMLPSLDVSYARGQYESLNQWQPGWTAMITLSIPIFNRLENYSQYRTQAELSREAELKLEQLKRDRLSQQHVDQENFKLALATAISRERTLDVAQRLLKTNLVRFRNGRIDANDLSLERDRETRASVLVVEGWSRAHLGLLRLYHSFGRSILSLN
jgi:outer membrane protein TolC